MAKDPKISIILEKAAEVMLMNNNLKYRSGGCCNAIGHAYTLITGENPSELLGATRYFNSIYESSAYFRGIYNMYYFGKPGTNRKQRSIALLLAAQMARSEGL